MCKANRNRTARQRKVRIGASFLIKIPSVLITNIKPDLMRHSERTRWKPPPDRLRFLQGYWAIMSAALSAGTLIATLLPEMGIDLGDGLNPPLALTLEPAIVIAVDVSDEAVRVYS